MTDLWSTYLRTVIDIELPGGGVRRLEQIAPTSDQDWPFDETHAWIMTACNPRSIPLSADENAQRHSDFSRAMSARGIRHVPNVGTDPEDESWREAGYTVFGIDEAEAAQWARDLEQNAIYGWWPDRFELIGVLLPGRTISTWRWAAAL